VIKIIKEIKKIFNNNKKYNIIISKEYYEEFEKLKKEYDEKHFLIDRFLDRPYYKVKNNGTEVLALFVADKILALYDPNKNMKLINKNWRFFSQGAVVKSYKFFTTYTDLMLFKRYNFLKAIRNHSLILEDEDKMRFYLKERRENDTSD